MYTKRCALFLALLVLITVASGAFAQDDRDGDGTPDGMDRCPDAGGPAWAGGCPDSDADNTPDIDDACPSVGGPDWNRGCPEDQPQITPTSPPPPTAPRPQPQAASPAQLPREPEPTARPPLIPSGPRVSLPPENACVLTPDGREPINIRAVPSLQGDVLGRFEPGNRAPAGLPVVVLEGESWYLTGGGWLVGRLMQGTPLCRELPVLSFAEPDVTLVNADNSLSPSIPVGMGETRPAQVYLMPSSVALLQQLAPRVQLPAGEGVLALRYPSLRGPTNEILVSLLMPLGWQTLADGQHLSMIAGVYVGYPQRMTEGREPTPRDTVLIDLATQTNPTFTLAIAGNGSLRVIGEPTPTDLRICSGDLLPTENDEGLMLADAVCPENRPMPPVAGLAVANVASVLLLNTDAAGRATLLVYEGRGTELIVQLLPGTNSSGGNTPLLALQQDQQVLTAGFHRPTQGMVFTLR